jgi:CRP-like cAMP-binding protein
MHWRVTEGVPEEDVRELLAIARRRRFARNEVVFHRDDPGDSMHLVVKGRFALQIMTPLGDAATIGIRGPGDSFGELALVASEPRRSATVVALEQAETFAVYREEFDRLRGRHPAVDRVLFAFLAGELRRQNELLLEALYLPVERRVLRRLVDLADLYPEQVIPLTQEQLAELAGTTRPTINRVLRDEQERGTLRLERGRTVILDAEALGRRARLSS